MVRVAGPYLLSPEVHNIILIVIIRPKRNRNNKTNSNSNNKTNSNRNNNSAIKS